MFIRLLRKMNDKAKNEARLFGWGEIIGWAFLSILNLFTLVVDLGMITLFVKNDGMDFVPWLLTLLIPVVLYWTINSIWTLVWALVMKSERNKKYEK